MNLNEANQLLADSLDFGANERWQLPFPMGVFGTLRSGRGNNPLMHRGKVSEHHKAFMPHFYANGLTINFKRDCSAPFEIFCYEPEEWDKMIPSVDRLEGFHPDYAKEYDYGYYRTLAWLHVLPDDFSHKLFERADIFGFRDLAIPLEEWNKFERVPCWVYSNRQANEATKEAGVDTVIWG